jgi:TonB family protein
MLHANRIFKITLTFAAAQVLAAAFAFCSEPKRVATHAKFPRIPDEARAKHLSGSGIIVVYVRPDGTVSKAEVGRSSGHKILDDAALAAFAQWQFIPGAVKKVKIPFTFTGNYTKPPNS